MGCLQSKKEFVVNQDVQGQDKAAQEIFDELGLSKHDVDLLYTAFWDIDADSSGTIRPVELFAYFQVEATPFEKGVFSLFDEDKSGLINFMEFVCCLWNLLTLPEPDLGSIAYLMKDPSGTSALKYGDIRSLLEIMHKKNVDLDSSLLTIFLRLKKDYNGLLTMAEFCRWTYTNPSVTTPLMMLQLHLRMQIIGETFWTRMSNERRLHDEQGRLDFVKRLQADVVAKNEAYKRRLQNIQNEKNRVERRGIGRAGDGRDNVTRKESVLLGYYRLKQSFSFRGQPNNARTAPTSTHSDAALDEGAAVVSDEVRKKPDTNGPARPRRSFLKKPNIVRKEDKGTGSKQSVNAEGSSGSNKKQTPSRQQHPHLSKKTKKTAADTPL